MMDFIQDNWKRRGTRPVDKQWTGKTFLRVFGPYESDYEVESSEVREALTDFEFVGQEKMGDYMVSLFPPKSIRGIFVEDNQATIRILENGNSPSFRHTDKTRRINLSWLSEQYKRGWYDLTYGPSKMQVADILTKPFTNAEKWRFALTLMSHVASKGYKTSSSDSAHATTGTPRPKAMASSRSSGEPRAGLKPNRLLVEICCSPMSKLSDVSREAAVGCRVIQFTEKHGLLDEEYQTYVASIVNDFPMSQDVPLWLSLPCTGGTSCSHVNLTIPSAAKKVMKHVKTMKKLWKAFDRFIQLLTRSFDVAIEWPQNCRYWRFPRILKFINEFSLKRYDFHGCMLGTKDHDGIPIKKPWTVATTIDEIGLELSQYQCDESHDHVQGRGKPLKETESYSYLFTDSVHKAFNRAAQSARTFACALITFSDSPVFAVMLDATSASISLPPHVEEAIGAGVSLPEGRPGSEHANWRQDANFQVEQIAPEFRLTIYERILQWEKKLATIRGSCVACIFPDGYEGANKIGSGQIPIGDVIDGLVGKDTNETQRTYCDIVDLVKDIPAALFGAVECPPEGEADLIIVGDSSFALVANHDSPVLCSRLSFGELLQSKDYAINQIRSVYPGLKWGKGLSAINHQIWELIEKVERENRLQNRATLPILVVVGWAGNDVHGDFGYQGCTWIHQTNLTKSEADRKVAAEYVDKQYKKVQRSLDGLVEISKDPRVWSVQVIGNGDHSGYSLPPSYNREMGKHVNWLAERGIQCVSSTMLAQGGKYDNYHLHDHQFNRKLVYRFLRGAITFHLKYVELMSKQEDLKYYVRKFISSEQDRVAAVHLFPTMVQFRLALLGTQEVMEAVSAERKTAPPAQVFDEADEEILMWVHAGILEANEEATREGRPQPTAFTDEEISSIVPVDPTVEDYETEEVRARHYLQEDLNQAIADGFSTTTIESIEVNPENTDVEDDVEVVPEFDEWDVVTDDKVIINPYDEKVKEDAISEERAKEVEDLNKIIEIASTEAKPSGTTASEIVYAAAKEASAKADEGEDKMKSSRISTWSVVDDDDSKPSDMTSSRISTWTEVGGSEATPMDVDAGKKKDDDAAREGVPTAAATPGASASSQQPADKTEIVDLTKTEKKVEVDKPVGKPAEKKMPKSEKQKAPESKAMPRQKAPRLSVEADAALRKLEEATERQEGAVWLDPDDMANRIPKEYCGQGRMRYLSTKMSYVLRGHALSYGARSPDIDPMDMPMDFEAVMKTMAHYVSYPKVREVLSIVRNSDSRRFQVKVAQPDLPDATWKGLPWKVIAIRAVQGHNRAVVENAKISSLVKQVFTLDPTFVKEDLDSGKLPRTNLWPDLVPELLAALPRVIYHSCDRLAMEKIVEHGLIPGGWPQRTGRAHNFFIASHPWDDSVGGKKLAGTRAGKQYYIAFDTELIVQSGCRLFRTDEAIISPDWISNENIICTYDAVNREFAWVNRPYEITRVGYKKQMKDHKDKDTPKREALTKSAYANAQASLKSYLMSGRSIHPGDMQMTNTPEEFPPLLRRREGPSGPFEDKVRLKMASFGALSNAETIRKGKGRGKGRGKGSRPGGQAQRSTNAEDYIYSTKIEMQQVKCHFCCEKNIEGTHKCQSCFKWLIAWSDGRIATEVCRMEITAKKTNKVFSLDKIDFEKQPRAQRVSDRTRADQRRAGRSNFGNLKDAAQTHAGRYSKLGYKSIQDRMEKDPFYLFNNAVGQITPDCCQFLEDLAKCIAPDIGRTREKREKQLGTGVSTRLIFMPDFNRDIRLPLDVTKEAMVAHHARVFTLPQFAVLAADLLKARGELTPTLFGWSGSMMPIDQQSAQDCFFDLVDFAKRQWNEQFHNIKGEEHSMVEEATASDVAEFPLARTTKSGTGEGREGYRRHFDPIQKPAKGKGYGHQRPIFQQAVECWKCGQYGHKSFECRSGWNRRQQWDSYGSYSSRSGGQAQWQSWNWRQGYSGKGWGADDWGRSTASSSSAAPPEPARPPSTATPVPDSAPTADTSAQEASGSTGSAQQTPMRSPIISEEYCEINGQPHYKRLLADGTIEYESW